jgi:hypothetical protein
MESELAMKVFVVMGNDFPAAVFDNEETAEAYIEHIKSEKPNPHIYWRVYPFDLG